VVTQQGINHKWMGHSNKLIVFNLIRVEGPITRTKLADISGLSKTAISSSVNKLLDRNLITESKHEDYEKVGRKPHLLSVNPKAAYFMSIDIGFTNLQVSLTNLSNQRVARTSFETPNGWEKLTQLLIEKINKTYNWSNFSVEDIKGVSIGIPGVVNSDGVVSYVPKIGSSQQYDLGEKLSSEIDTPLLLENNVNLATLGELSIQYEDFSNLIYVSFHRSGIGAGIVIDGNLYKGSAYHAGEIGWLVTDKNRLEENHVNNQGYLESKITAPALVKKSRETLQKRGSYDPLFDEIGGPQDLDIETIFRNYRTSSIAHQIIQGWIKDVATSLIATSSILDPELVVLGGEIIDFAKPVFQELTDFVDHNTQRTPRIEVSDNYRENVLHGGARLCFENLNSLIWEEPVHSEIMNP